jgi:hypothetical protein
MATTNLREEIQTGNRNIEQRIGQLGMSLRTYKLIKAITQLVGAGAGIYAMSLGADPLTAFALVAFIVSGPEALDFMLSHQTSNPENSETDK